jgi:hypothetical protein
VAPAALAFVGLGDPSVTSLGQLAANGFAFVAHAPWTPWMWISPVAAIVALTVPVAMLAGRAPARAARARARPAPRVPPQPGSASGESAGSAHSPDPRAAIRATGFAAHRRAESQSATSPCAKAA